MRHEIETTVEPEEHLRTASDLLYRSWQEGCTIDALPQALKPASRSEAYAIQALLETRSAKPLFGWKIAATSSAGQAHIGVDGPLAGRILHECVIPDGGTAPFGANRMRVAEIEFAFAFGRDLAPREERYSQQEVLDAVASLHPAIEIPDSRFADFVTAGAEQLIADNACAHRFVLGPATEAAWRDLDLADYPVLGKVTPRAGQTWEHKGLGANVLGDPRIALTWLVNELRQEGVILTAGSVVTTGTCVVPMEIAPGDRIEGDFGPLGGVSLRLSEG